jgi:arabinogalactan oligomer / maltooligosaccharide transport system permease protein
MDEGQVTGQMNNGPTRRRRRIGRVVAIYLFVLPALIPMLFIVGFPLAQTIFFSFTNLKERNFNLWTLGLKPAKEQTGGATGAVAEVAPKEPAARSGVPDRSVIIEVNGERVRNAAALKRLIEKAEREFTNRRASDVKVVYLRPESETTRTASLVFERKPFDWAIKPDRDSQTWGLVGLKNYRDILIPSAESNMARQFYRVFGVTVLWTVLNVSLHYMLGLGLALLLNRRVAGSRFYRVILMLPWAVPVYVSAFAWRWLFNNQYGFFNVLLARLGHSPIPWLSDAVWTFVAVTATNVWLGVPFMMIMLLAGLQSIPQDLYEQAEIDGCTRWQTVLSVTLPLLRPVSTTVILLGAIWTFNVFNVIWLVQGGGNNIEILATYAFRLFRDFQDYAGAAAYGVIIFLMLMVFSMVYLRVLHRDEGVY